MDKFTVPKAGNSLGARVHALRKNRNLTLTELGDLTGLSPSALSKIEREKLSPTYNNLVKLAEGLNINAAELFDAPNRKSDKVEIRADIMRVDEGELVKTDNYDFYALHTDVRERSIWPMIADIRAQTMEEFGDYVVHPGEEFSYVVSGLVELHRKGREPIRLSPGETIYFDGSRPHAYLSASRGPSRILTVVLDIFETMPEQKTSEK